MGVVVTEYLTTPGVVRKKKKAVRLPTGNSTGRRLYAAMAPTAVPHIVWLKVPSALSVSRSSLLGRATRSHGPFWLGTLQCMDS